MSVNRFVLNETSYFGKGAREELPEEISKRKFKKVLVVTDKALFECGVTAKVTEVTKIQQQRKQIRKQVLHRKFEETADQKFIIVRDKETMTVWEHQNI